MRVCREIEAFQLYCNGGLALQALHLGLMESAPDEDMQETMDDLNEELDEVHETDIHIDDSVGSLVWVRRRNGSWWPGRVISQEEVLSSRLLSKRSGTPVKLLGKEDASVDWYNFGKSKRIKAFRCGEFDGCIDKAVALSSTLLRKRVKNARRDDAIIQALELERQQAEQRDFLMVDRMSSWATEVVSEAALHSGVQRFDPQSDSIHSINTVPPAGIGGPLMAPCEAEGGLDESICLERQIDSEWEDDAPETIPRMRDLQDLGLRIAPLKRKKANYSCTWEDSSKVQFAVDESNKTESCITKDAGSGACAVPSNARDASYRPGPKHKKCHTFTSADETILKRRDRRKPLTQVLKSSARLAGLAVNDFAQPSVLHDKALILGQQMQNQEESLFEEPLNMERGSKSNLDERGVEQPHSLQASCSRVMIEPFLTTDNSCSSLLMSNCCTERITEAASLNQMGLIDHPYGERPTLTCSFPSGSAHTGSATSVNVASFDKSGCEVLASHSGFPCQNLKRATCGSESLSNPYGSALHSHMSSLCVPHHKGPEDYNSALSKKRIVGVEPSLPVPWREINPKSVTAMKGFLRQGFLSSSDCLTGEDEAESLQAIQDGGSKWRAKRRRNNRGFGTVRRRRNSCRNPDVCLVESEQGHVGASRSTVKPSKKTVVGRGHRIGKLQMCNEQAREKQLCDESRHSQKENNFSTASAQASCNVRSFLKDSVNTRSMKLLQDVGMQKGYLPHSTHQQGWIDVPLKSRIAQRGDSVALVSLFSKLSNKVVVGHPVPIERLENRSQTGWRLAKQCNNRKNSGRKVCRRTIKQQVMCVTKDKKFVPAKTSRRSGSTFQKTKKLSSLVFQSPVKSENKDSIIPKAQESSLVSCIPVHVIFSRIREVLYKQPLPGDCKSNLPFVNSCKT